MKDYKHLLHLDARYADAAARVSELASDVCEFLHSVGLQPPEAPRRLIVAVHDPCSLRNVQRITEAPRSLLKQAGFELREIAEGHFCCGSAGTYNLLEPELARRLGERKADHIQGTDAQIVAAGNIGCVVQIGRYASLPVVHPIELLDWAWGGPQPAGVGGVDLVEVPPSISERPPLGVVEAAPSPPETSASGIW